MHALIFMFPFRMLADEWAGARLARRRYENTSGNITAEI